MKFGREKKYILAHQMLHLNPQNVPQCPEKS